MKTTISLLLALVAATFTGCANIEFSANQGDGVRLHISRRQKEPTLPLEPFNASMFSQSRQTKTLRLINPNGYLVCTAPGQKAIVLRPGSNDIDLEGSGNIVRITVHYVKKGSIVKHPMTLALANNQFGKKNLTVITLPKYLK